MTIFDKLQKYFNETSKEQIQKDWDKSKEFDKVNSPTIEQFMLHGVGVNEAAIPHHFIGGGSDLPWIERTKKEESSEVELCGCNKPRYIDKGDVLRCIECKKASAII